MLGVLYASGLLLQWWISGVGQDSKTRKFIESIDSAAEERIIAAAKAEADKWSEAELDLIRMPYGSMDAMLPGLHAGFPAVYLEGRDLARVEFPLGRSRILVFSPKRKFGHNEEVICRKDNWTLFGIPRTD
ncbi:MAG TPA: hypothetical protein VIM46_04425 [Luteolibacter sp.]